MQNTITAIIKEKEIVTVNFKVLDVIQYYRKYIETNTIKEQAIMVSDFPTKDFETSLVFVPGTLSVFLNGLRERYLTVTGDKTFSLPIDAINGDTIDIEYIELI